MPFSTSPRPTAGTVCNCARVTMFTLVVMESIETAYGAAVTITSETSVAGASSAKAGTDIRAAVPAVARNSRLDNMGYSRAWALRVTLYVIS